MKEFAFSKAHVQPSIPGNTFTIFWVCSKISRKCAISFRESVPDFEVNLLSYSRATKEGFYLNHDFDYLQHLDDTNCSCQSLLNITTLDICEAELLNFSGGFNRGSKVNIIEHPSRYSKVVSSSKSVRTFPYANSQRQSNCRD
jgi:hypothetical protein